MSEPASAPLSVRIAVVSHQSASVLPQLLASIDRARERAAGRAQAEVVVADNASADGSAAVAGAAGARVVALDDNLGFGTAANRALAGADAAWLVVLNPDLVLDDGFLVALADLAPRLAPDVGIVGAALANPDGSRQPSVGDFPTFARTLTALRRPRMDRKYRTLAAHLAGPADWVTGAAVAVRAECWQATGGFDPGYFLYYEDTDLCRRASDAGWRTRFEPALRATHLTPLAQRPLPPRLVPVVRYAQLRYFRAHRPAHELWGLALCVGLWTFLHALAARTAPLAEGGAAIDWTAVRRALRAGVAGTPGPRLGRPAPARTEPAR